MLDSESKIGVMLKQDSLMPSVQLLYAGASRAEVVELASNLREVAKTLLRIRSIEYEDLFTDKLVLRIPCSVGDIELRDLPGLGHTDWRLTRDVIFLLSKSFPPCG